MGRERENDEGEKIKLIVKVSESDSEQGTYDHDINKQKRCNFYTSLFISASHYLYIYIPIYASSIHPSTSISPSIYLSIHLSYVCIDQCTHNLHDAAGAARSVLIR